MTLSETPLYPDHPNLIAGVDHYIGTVGGVDFYRIEPTPSAEWVAIRGQCREGRHMSDNSLLIDRPHTDVRTEEFFKDLPEAKSYMIALIALHQ